MIKIFVISSPNSFIPFYSSLLPITCLIDFMEIYGHRRIKDHVKHLR